MLGTPITLTVCLPSRVFACARLIKKYALNMCNSLHDDYTSAKLEGLQSPTCGVSLGLLV